MTIKALYGLGYDTERKEHVLILHGAYAPILEATIEEAEKRLEPMVRIISAMDMEKRQQLREGAK